MAATKDYVGTGRRKSSVARVRIKEGSGKIQVNGRQLDHFFTEEKDRNAVTGPLVLTDLANRVDVTITVNGGGITGQAGAASQGVARALKTMFGPAPTTADEPETESSGIAKKLRDSGYLTRDSRMKERKKYGRKGARKSFQFSKR
ncbi:30S ribosomal protein S9 [Telmatocola sphagniphila]|uniref:Small ribosomal subunit protein uS9 n=1 Tax=Telmatocola sphagniphila TaxID=1123043 RepID=A0A8E6B9E4_9BACT|nr:30S ribosomal protein S9 [Telmatocola sphagniphila]QVL34635.1 30S ribosomal protein S9 [Telmatocola sphagniphila]